ncbi:hypothetical protein EDC04DRAFT_2742515 [Pisolithus marmoratus]|nr:hypothetical protein EDC04DRAFT_2742515 [Pisolithus marmoratus]
MFGLDFSLLNLGLLTSVHQFPSSSVLHGRLHLPDSVFILTQLHFSGQTGRILTLGALGTLFEPSSRVGEG